MEGKEGQSSVEEGKMVADRFIAKPLSRALAEAARSGWVMTGFPRTEAQVHMLQGLHAAPSMIVVLEADPEECKRGCRQRRVDRHVTPAEVYDLDRRPPSHEDVTARLSKRKDDDPATVNLRLHHFRSRCYGVLHALDPEDEITLRIATRDTASQTLGDIVELVEAVQEGLTTDSNNDFLIDLFTTADIDHSGSVEMPELYEAMQNAGVEVKKEHISAIIDTADNDGDGQLTLDEFLSCFDGDTGEMVSDLVATATSGGRDHTGWRNFCEVLSRSNVRRLNAAEIGMDDTAATTLANSLNDEIVDLNIRGNPSGPKGVAALSQAYKNKPQLVSLLGIAHGVQSIDLSQHVMTPSSNALLAEEIKDGRSLSSLASIIVNSTGKSEDPRKIYLKSDMKHVDVSDLNFGASDALLLAAFLRANVEFNSSLRSLKATTTGDAAKPLPYSLQSSDKVIE